MTKPSKLSFLEVHVSHIHTSIVARAQQTMHAKRIVNLGDTDGLVIERVFVGCDVPVPPGGSIEKYDKTLSWGIPLSKVVEWPMKIEMGVDVSIYVRKTTDEPRTLHIEIEE